MKTKLEKVLEYIIAKKDDKARALLHEYFVESARSIHEELMQDEDFNETASEDLEKEECSEGDDEMAFETMFGENELMDAETPDMGGADAAAGDLGAEMGTEEPSSDEETPDMGGGDDEMGGGSEDEKLASIKAQIEKLTQAFAELTGDNKQETGESLGFGEGDDDEGDGSEFDFNFGGDDEGPDDESGESLPSHDEDSEEHKSDGSDVIPDGDDDDDMSSMGGEDGEDEEGDDEEETDESFLEDIDLESMMNEDGLTESILDELESVHVNMTGGEIGAAGSKFTPNNTSPINKNRNAGAAKPVQIKSDNHSGYNRETAPTSKEGTGAKNPKNTQKSWDSNLEQKKKEGDTSALLNNKGSGYGAENNTSPLSKVTRPTVGGSAGKKK